MKSALKSRGGGRCRGDFRSSGAGFGVVEWKKGVEYSGEMGFLLSLKEPKWLQVVTG